MKYTDAFKHLNISLDTHFEPDKITLKYIKRRYHAQALLHHPDKNNNTLESIEKFKKINESYVWLSNNIDNSKLDEFLHEPTTEQMSSQSTTSIYKIFEKLCERLNANIVVSIASTLIHAVLITPTLKEKYLKIIDNMDESTCLYMYETFKAYQQSTNCELPELADWIKDVTAVKCGRLEIIHLSPSIDDLFDANLIQYEKYGTTFIIPTWFPVSSFELEFDYEPINYTYNKKYTKEIRFTCRPLLQSNISIADDTNDISVNIFNDNVSNIEHVTIGKRNFDIILSEIDKENLKTYHYIGYTIMNAGVPCLNYVIEDNNNINDQIERANIIIYFYV